MFRLLGTYSQLIVLILAGVLLAGACQSEYWLLAFVAVAIVARVIEAGAVQLLPAYAFGVAYQLLGVEWMRHVYSSSNVTQARVANWIIVALICGTASIVLIAVGVWLRRKTKLPLWLIVPIAWTVGDWFRWQLGWIISGVPYPWLNLSLTQTNIYLLQVADLGGIWAVSFLVAMLGAARSRWPVLIFLTAMGYGWLRLCDLPGGPSVAIMPATSLVVPAANLALWSEQAFEEPSIRTTYAYDPAGNFVSSFHPAGRTTATWDAQNRMSTLAMTQRLHPASAVNVQRSFTYNGDGLLVDTGSTQFLWDRQNILMELDAFSAAKAKYTLKPALYGELVSQRRGDVSGFYTFDALGSTRGLYDAALQPRNSYYYTAFGESLPLFELDPNSFRFVGKYGYLADPQLASYYVRARHYSPLDGRWFSRDPLGFYIGEYNLYLYVLNNSLGSIDPSGLNGWEFKVIGCALDTASRLRYGNYCGPGARGVIPLDALDAACLLHDECYKNAGVAGISGAFAGRFGNTAAAKCDHDLCVRAKSVPCSTWECSTYRAKVRCHFCYQREVF